MLWGTVKEGVEQGYEWTWVELLEGLAQNWPWLRWEQGWPIGANPIDPGAFDEETRKVFALSSRSRLGLETELFEFRESHDLSRFLSGVKIPPLWVVNEGRCCWFGSEGNYHRLPSDAMLETLQEVGEAIADRLTGVEDERCVEVLEAWKNRDNVEPPEFLSMVSGLSDEELAGFTTDDRLSLFELSDGPLEENELLAVARMSSHVVLPGVLDKILGEVRAIDSSSVAAIDVISARMMETKQEWSSIEPHEEGCRLARLMRRQLNLPPEKKADPEALLRSWGVIVHDINLEDPAIEAVACWGQRHGPAVLVNRSGRHSDSSRGRRASLAHEVCHFLVDRNGALPFSEVMGGLAPKWNEQRANAFGAEFLIPQEVAGAAFASAGNHEKSLRRLANRYGASHELIAWQAHNSKIPLHRSAAGLLKTKVTQPHLWRPIIAA